MPTLFDLRLLVVLGLMAVLCGCGGNTTEGPSPESTLDKQAVEAKLVNAGGKVKKDGNGQITLVDFAGKPLDEPLMEQIGQLPKLQKLILRGSTVSDASFAKLGSPKDLQVLDARETPLTGAVLEQLGQCTQLRNLQFRGNPITDDDLKQLSGLKQLQVLGLDETAVDGNSLEALSGLGELTEIYLFGTPFLEANLPKLAAFSKLKKDSPARNPNQRARLLSACRFDGPERLRCQRDRIQ